MNDVSPSVEHEMLGEHDATPAVNEDTALEQFYNKELGITEPCLPRPWLRNIQHQITELKNRARVPLNTDALTQWRGLKLTNPDLYKLATIMLAVPSSQVSVERAFSALALVLTNRRTAMTSENLENILLLKLNFNLMDQIKDMELG